MSPDTLYLYLGIILGALAFLGWLFKRAIPKVRDFFGGLNGVIDAVGGRDAYVDPASGRKVERLLPLTTRVATIEEALIQIANDRTLMHRIGKRLAHVETRVDSLEKASIERIAMRVENASAMNMIEKLQDDYSDINTDDGDDVYDAGDDEEQP